MINNSTSPALPTVARSDFVKDFMWGCSTSSYQIEGAHDVDGKVESIWDRFSANRENIGDGADGKIACDHYHRWPEDLDIARDIGFNAYRFSIAWPRIFSEKGNTPNQQGIDFYSRLVDGMLARGLQPWATLYHWDLPQVLQDKGGWNDRDTVAQFVKFADVMSHHLGDRVKNWITHNEPWCTAMHGNWDGMHAPGNKDFKTALQVCHHVLLSHGLAIPVIKANVPDAKVGLALSLHPVKSASDSPEDIAAMVRHDGLRNRWFLDPLHGKAYPDDIWQLCGGDVPVVQQGDLAAIATATDFMGVNYYFPEVIANAPENLPLQTKVVVMPDLERTAFGWEVAPEGMATLLKRIVNDYQPSPIYITENGSTYQDELAADGSVDDVERRNYFIRHLAVLRDVIADGVQVKGYFAWSLMDNFEWAEGFRRRFGMVYVDFETQKRTVKTSGRWYARFLKGEI